MARQSGISRGADTVGDIAIGGGLGLLGLDYLTSVGTGMLGVDFIVTGALCKLFAYSADKVAGT